MAEKKHARSLKRLNVTTKHNRVNTAVQIRKQKLQATRQTRETIGAIDGVPQLIVRHSKELQISPWINLDTDSSVIGCEYLLDC